MKHNRKERLNHWTQGPLRHFLLSQIAHTVITLSVLALLLVGARQVGALDGLLAPATQGVGSSATTINYQGRLANENGTALNGQYDLKFAIYDAAEGGVMIWPTDSEPELHEDVTVSDGLFSVGLGSRTTGGVPASVWSGDRYLQVWVESEELAPRELLRSVPIAGMAFTVPDESITEAKIADGSVTSGKLSRTMHEVVATESIPMPVHAQKYEVFSYSLDLERETLVTIYSSIAPQNNTTDTLFRSEILVDTSVVAWGESWHKSAVGETIVTQGVVLLGPGQHEIVVLASSWDDNGTVSGDKRTKLVIVEG